MKRILLLLAYSIAMAFVESAVVVYLRALYYPEGFTGELKYFQKSHYITEIVREVATIIMLVSVSLLSFKEWRKRFGCFLFIFGTWDIFYYVFLYFILRWPPSLGSMDVLFLIPIPWIAPVFVPLIISLGMIIFGLWLILIKKRVHL